MLQGQATLCYNQNTNIPLLLNEEAISPDLSESISEIVVVVPGSRVEPILNETLNCPLSVSEIESRNINCSSPIFFSPCIWFMHLSNPTTVLSKISCSRKSFIFHYSCLAHLAIDTPCDNHSWVTRSNIYEELQELQSIKQSGFVHRSISK